MPSQQGTAVANAEEKQPLPEGRTGKIVIFGRNRYTGEQNVILCTC